MDLHRDFSSKTLSVSRSCYVDNRVVNERGAVGGMIGETELFGVNLRPCYFVYHKSLMTRPVTEPGHRAGKPNSILN